MAKLMAPNIRIDWYPDGHFQDIHNPTVDELNSGYNLSCAITTGYTLDFTDPTTEEYSGVLSDFTVQVYSRDGYEANLQFFLATRGSSSANEQAYRVAEYLFYNPNQSVGYLVKRFGYLSHVDYGDVEEQRIDIFKVQADIPKVLSEDGEPILLDIRFIPQGFAASAVIAPWLPPMDAYLWEGPTNNSTSAYYNENRVLSKRNYILNPSFESNSLDSNLTITNMVEYKIVEEPFYGSRALWVAPNHNESNPPQIQFRTLDNSTMQDAWMGFSLNLRLKANNVARAHMYIGYNNVRVSVVDKVISNEYVNIKVGPVQVPAGATNIRAVLFLYDYYISGNLGDEEVLIDGLQLVRGDSAAEVEYQLETYFDGNGEKPLPPPANDWDSPLKWEGEAHNSPSYLELDGQIIARNLVHNPSFEIGTEGWDFESDFVGNGFVLSNSSTVKAGSSLGRVDSNRNGGGTYFTLKISNSALPKIDPSHKWVGGRFFFYAHRNSMGEGNSWVREVSLLDSDKNVLLTDIRESRIPATQDYQSWVLPNIVGAEYVQFKIHFNRVTPNTVNSYQYIDAVQITSSHTFEDLAQQLRIYMDGSTRPESAGILELTKPSTQYAWLGEPHNSPSVKIVDGEVVARNLFSNPSFELGLEGVEHSGNASLTHVGGLAVATGDYGMQVEINNASINAGWVRQVAPVSSDDWGKWVGWSAVVRNSRNVLSLRWYYEVRQGTSVLSGGYVGNFPVDGTLLPDAPRHSFAVQVDHGADNIRFWLRPTEALSSARYFTDDWMGVLSDSEQEALDQAATYFDGDTPDEYL